MLCRRSVWCVCVCRVGGKGQPNQPDTVRNRWLGGLVEWPRGFLTMPDALISNALPIWSFVRKWIQSSAWWPIAMAFTRCSSFLLFFGFSLLRPTRPNNSFKRPTHQSRPSRMLVAVVAMVDVVDVVVIAFLSDCLLFWLRYLMC